MRPTLLAVAGAALLTAGAPASDEFPVSRTQNHSTQQSTLATAGPSPVVAAVAAPHGSDGLAVRWVSISAPDLGTMLAAVATPAGRPPFPSVLLLHGTHGFAREYVELAVELSRGGVLAVAACWFSGAGGEGMRFVTPIACTDAPPVTPAASDSARRTVDVLLQAVRHLPNARPDRAAFASLGASRDLRRAGPRPAGANARRRGYLGALRDFRGKSVGPPRERASAPRWGTDKSRIRQVGPGARGERHLAAIGRSMNTLDRDGIAN